MPPPFLWSPTEPLIPPDKVSGLFDEGTVLGDPARRARLGVAGQKVAELTVLLAAVSRIVPGFAGKALAFALAGVEKDPGTGRVRPGPHTAGNFAPSPLGFLDPEAIGLSKNFYLPSGSTDFIPRIADRAGLGLPEQRAIDEANNARLLQNQIDSNRQKASVIAGRESDDVLRDLAVKSGGFSRSGIIFGTSGVPADNLAQAAVDELNRRNGNTNPFGPARGFPIAITDNIGRSVATIASAFGSGDDPLIPAPGKGGPIDPTATRPVSNDGQEASDRAPPIVKNLATERNDP